MMMFERKLREDGAFGDAGEADGPPDMTVSRIWGVALSWRQKYFAAAKAFVASDNERQSVQVRLERSAEALKRSESDRRLLERSIESFRAAETPERNRLIDRLIETLEYERLR